MDQTVLTIDSLPEDVLKKVVVQLDHPGHSLWRDLAAQYGFPPMEIETFTVWAGQQHNNSPTRYLFHQLRNRHVNELNRLRENLKKIDALSVDRIIEENMGHIIRNRGIEPPRPPEGRLRIFIASAPSSRYDQECVLKLKSVLDAESRFSIFHDLQIGGPAYERQSIDSKLSILHNQFLEKSDVVIYCLSGGLQYYLNGPDSAEPKILEIQRCVRSIYNYVVERRDRPEMNLAIVRFYKINPQTVPDWLLQDTRRYDFDRERDSLVRYLHGQANTRYANRHILV